MEIKKKVRNLNKFNPTKAYSAEDINKFGFWIIDTD